LPFSLILKKTNRNFFSRIAFIVDSSQFSLIISSNLNAGKEICSLGLLLEFNLIVFTEISAF
jgi:hypothetical protein